MEGYETEKMGAELSPAQIEKACRLLRILSEPSRLKIVLALMKGNLCVYHLAELSGGTVSGVSHQLRILREANIVKVERLGKQKEYSIADEHVREIVRITLQHSECQGGAGI